VVVEMNIGIISERLNRPLTGVGIYTQHLIKEISLIYPKDKIYLIDYRDYEMFKNLNKIIIVPWIKYLPQKSYFWHLYLQFKLRKNNLDLDLIHSPENATLFVKLKNQKKIVTVHDIRQHVFPKFNKATTLSYLFLPRTLKTTDKIITVSNSTKKDLIHYFNVPEEKIKVILLAADEKFQPLNDEETKEVKQKYHLNFPFILYLGGLAAHKNISTLIKAFYTLKKKKFQHKLVITGKKRWKYNEIFETIDKLNLQKDVIFTGYVPDEDLPALYNAADLFVYPSLYEGFGLPPLEAMVCGTPVITSNTSSLPEVVGDAGIMVDPYDVDGLADAMYDVLTNDGLREEMIKKGLERTKRFSWEKCARETLKVYEEVYSGR
jgi:glycosyltransferase involved in cell wall biosynthesis